MVEKPSCTYLFIGQDSPAKDTQLAKIKAEFLSKDIADFNLDKAWGRELTLKKIQEKLLLLPVKAAKRVFVIKDASSLKEDVKEFILKFLKGPQQPLVLVLDMPGYSPRDEFARAVARFAKVYRFSGEPAQSDAFVLNRQIELKKTDTSLRLLHQLLENGEKPERIMGGLRYSWEKGNLPPPEKRKRLRLLLNCDLEIKRGRLKSDFALERLVVSLCSLRKS